MTPGQLFQCFLIAELKEIGAIGLWKTLLVQTKDKNRFIMQVGKMPDFGQQHPAWLFFRFFTGFFKPQFQQLEKLMAGDRAIESQAVLRCRKFFEDDLQKLTSLIGLAAHQVILQIEQHPGPLHPCFD